MQGLAELGVDCDLISTRRPPDSIVSHGWAEQAQERTTYLVPFSLVDGLGSLAMLLKAGPARWARCVAIVAGKSDLTAGERRRLLFLMLPAAKLAWHAKRNGIDHIHVQSCSDAANIAMLASLIGGVRYSLSLLGPTLEGYGPNQPNKWRYASFGVVMSNLLHKVVLERLAGHLPPFLEVLPVGVDLDVIRRKKAYEPWRWVGECRIYSCGRLNKIKGHRDLIDSIGLLRQNGIPAKLVIAGEDEQGGTGYRRELERHIEASKAGDFVTLLGAVGEDRHRELLEDAHLFALSSLNEGISVAIMEAMAMEMPVVVTNVGGNAELIDDGVNGVFAIPEAPARFAETLQSVLSSPDLALKLSGASRRKVAEKFDSRNSAAILAACLDRSAKEASIGR